MYIYSSQTHGHDNEQKNSIVIIYRAYVTHHDYRDTLTEGKS